MKEYERRAYITIENFSEEDESGTSVFTIEGIYAGRGNLHTLQYEENDASGMKGTTTRVTFKQGSASLVRKGAVNSVIQFYPGKIESSYYETPYGAILMEVETKHVSFINEPGGCRGRISYKMTFGGDVARGENKDMRIRVIFLED